VIPQQRGRLTARRPPPARRPAAWTEHAARVSAIELNRRLASKSVEMHVLTALALGLLAGYPVQPYARLKVIACGPVSDAEIFARVLEMRQAVSLMVRVPAREITPEQCPVEVKREPLEAGGVPHTTVSVDMLRRPGLHRVDE